MIILAIFDALYWIVSGIGNLVLPALPEAFTNILTYIFNLIDNGMSFVFTVLVDKSVVVAIASWLIPVFVAMFAYDVIWRIVHMIKLEHKHQEEG